MTFRTPGYMAGAGGGILFVDPGIGFTNRQVFDPVDAEVVAGEVLLVDPQAAGERKDRICMGLRYSASMATLRVRRPE